MDPIEALQAGIAKGRNIERENGFVHIGGHVFPSDTLTCMKKFGASDSKNSEKDSSYYSLDSVCFFWNVFSSKGDVDQANYALKCADNDVDAISFKQKESLLDYLKGKSHECEYFDLTAPFRYVKSTNAAVKVDATEENVSKEELPSVMGIQNYKRVREILGNEKVYETRSKVIQLNAKSTFLEAIDMIRREEKPSNRVDEDWQGRMNVSAMTINPEEGFLTQATAPVEKRINEAIIIVAPSGGNNVVTMFNVEKFMEKGEYISSDEVRKHSLLKPQEVQILHEINGHPIRFRFIDNPTKLSTGDWDRVICVLAGSQAWQYRGWRISDPATLFSKGVFVWFNEMPMPVIVKGWNVQVVSIHRDVRSMDAVARVQFWDLVDKVIKTKRMDLLK